MELGETFLTPSSPIGPDSGRWPVGALGCCVVPECLYFVSGLLKLFADTKNTVHSPCKSLVFVDFFF